MAKAADEAMDFLLRELQRKTIETIRLRAHAADCQKQLKDAAGFLYARSKTIEKKTRGLS